MKKEIAYQLHLPDSSKQTEDLNKIFRFPEGTVIYIDGYSAAVLREVGFGRKTSTTIRGLTAYIATSRLDLYRDNRFWSEPEGTIFTAYSKHAKKITKA